MTEPMLQPEPKDRKERHGRIGQALLGLGMALLLMLAFFYGLRTGDLSTEVDVKETEKQQAQDHAETAERKLNAALDRVLALCQAGGADVERLHQIGLCDQAAKEKSDPAPVAPRVSFGQVSEVVEAYLKANPVQGQRPTPEQILPMVQQVYRENPPSDGRTPSDEELLELIRQVYAANPPQNGKDGKDGQSPPCLSEPNQCRGADGADGKPPAAWTWTDSAGREQSCSRSGGSDDAPTYTCTAEPPAQPTPTTTTTAPLLPPS